MSTESSLDGATPVEYPTTPQPIDIDTDLPVLPGMVTGLLNNATLLGGASTSVIVNDSNNLAKPARKDMTPPPSTQVRTSRPDRDDSPTSSRVSSPSMTTTSIGWDSTRSSISDAHIDTASSEQLREMVRGLIGQGTRSDAALAEARMTIAHLNLQMNMLSAEKESELQRMEVEHNMTKREVKMLSMARSDTTTPGSSLLTNYIKLDEKHQALVLFAETLQRRLERAKKVIEAKADTIEDLKEDIVMYRKRIQEKHDLYHALRSPGGPYHSSNLKTPAGSIPNTPQQHRGTPKRAPMSARTVGREEPFAALLLADRVLSQENNSEPSTPIITRRTEPRTPIRHNRGAQSLSALQTTPGSVHHIPSNVSLLPAAHIRPTPRRRKSRDSTISAPDAEEIARAALSSFRDDSEEVYESHASQTATEMLRTDPRESFEVSASRTGTPIQAKMFGPVTKGVIDKRKYVDDHGEQLVKKARLASEVGLGIGFSPR